jgi:hypothetical protein
VRTLSAGQRVLLVQASTHFISPWDVARNNDGKIYADCRSYAPLYGHCTFTLLPKSRFIMACGLSSYVPGTIRAREIMIGVQ